MNEFYKTFLNMRKKGFTLLEVVLAVTLFWLMIGVILQAYTSIQLGNVKVLDTQKTIEVSENLFERLNDMSMDYVIDTWKYTWLDYAQIQNNENTKIINTWTLWLKQINDNISISIFTWCMSWNCSLYIQSNSTTKGCDVYSKWCIPTRWVCHHSIQSGRRRNRVWCLSYPSTPYRFRNSHRFGGLSYAG